jgi:steroid 5-alpha reductase family enzyme
MLAYLIILVVLLVYMTGWFLIALWRRRNDVADVAWGIGFIVAASAALVVKGTGTPRAWVVYMLVMVWGVRLAVHIGTRLIKHAEDQRYRNWREAWGARWRILSFVRVFMLQGGLLYVISLPIICIILADQSAWTWLDGLGVIVWVVGFLFEVVGDYQLKSFVQSEANRGKIMQQGLWKYTRHPNYFGEVTLWWGIYLIAISTPGGWLTIIGPVTISFLILKVSGIPLLEKEFMKNPEFQEYARRTSAFFPLPPRKDG